VTWSPPLAPSDQPPAPWRGWPAALAADPCCCTPAGSLLPLTRTADPGSGSIARWNLKHCIRPHCEPKTLINGSRRQFRPAKNRLARAAAAVRGPDQQHQITNSPHPRRLQPRQASTVRCGLRARACNGQRSHRHRARRQSNASAGQAGASGPKLNASSSPGSPEARRFTSKSELL